MKMEKFCFTCKQDKPVDEFGKRVASPDGLAAKCKDCQRAYDKARANKPDRVAAREAYAKTNAGREARRMAQRKYADGHRQEATERCRKYRENNKKKSRAHELVAYAIRLGALVKQPCEACGSGSHVAHHDDYDKPLDVRWLCATHHREWHSENGEGANAS